jgi:XTP/dITP diphosphohydrolase
MRQILFATANRHKVEEVQQLIGEHFEIVTPAQLGYTGDIPETGDTLEENALQKARFVFEKFGLPCFADDTGLEIEALNGAPGVRSARYAGEEKDAAANMQRVLENMRGITHRGARFRCVIALVAGEPPGEGAGNDGKQPHRLREGREWLFEGKVSGVILTEPHGDKGFGYDPIFRPEGFRCSFAEMPAEEKNRLSHRGEAVTKLVKFLSAAAKREPFQR